MHNGTLYMITHDMLGHISIYDVVHCKECMNVFFIKSFFNIHNTNIFLKIIL